MSKETHDNFALVIKNLVVDWQPKHITIGLFEVNEILKQNFARN
jgi:hypothetical protein